jgi:hypothetical protein
MAPVADRLREEFNSEVTRAAFALMPDAAIETPSPINSGERFVRWRETSRHPGLMGRAAAVIPENRERPALDAARAEVHLDVENGLPLVLADPLALKLAIRNLLSNATKYGAEAILGLACRRHVPAMALRSVLPMGSRHAA